LDRARQQQHGDVREARALLDEVADVVPVLLGHDDVAQQDVGRRLLNALQREPPVADRHHLEVLVREGQLDHLLDGDAVIGQQDLLAHRQPPSRRKSTRCSDEDRRRTGVCQSATTGSGGRSQAGTADWMSLMTSWVDEPGRNTSATPMPFSSGMSWAGMMPPTNILTVSIPFSWSSSRTRRQ